MNINRIASIVNKNFLRGNRFQVSIGAPGVVGAPPQVVNDNVCAVTYPGATYSTFEWRNAGPTIKVPYQVLFDQVTMEFYVDNEAAVSKWLRKWNTSVMSEDFRFNFWADYIADIKIKEMNVSGATVSTCTLVNAYPVTVSPVQLSFENQNQIEKISVEFTYEYKTEG